MKNFIIIILLLYFVSDVFKNKPTHFFNSEDININDTFYIVPLGYVEESRLVTASKTIKKYYGNPTKLMNQIDIPKSFYVNDYLDANKSLHKLGKLNNTLFVTNEKLLNSNDLSEVLGLSLYSGKNSIVTTTHIESTIVHEIGHNKGLIHCRNKYCVMSTYDLGYSEKYDIRFCENCSRIIKN